MQNTHKILRHGCHGFSLIELIVVVAIIAILAGVAWPMYEAQSFKNRRTEAIDDLGRIQVFMARCYADNGGYDCCLLSDFTNANPPPIGGVRQYTLALTMTNVAAGQFACKQAQGYTVTATAGGSQTGDDACDSFTIDHLGNRTALDSTATAKPACWGD